MDKHEAGEVNMDTKALDGREAVVEMVREARVAAAEDRFLTNRATTKNHYKGGQASLWWFLFSREGRGADGRPYGRRYCR